MVSQEKMVQLLTDVELLKLEIKGLNHTVAALTTLMCELSPESAVRTKKLLEVMIPYANHMDTPPSGSVVNSILRFVNALTDSGADPILVLAILARQAEDAGPERLSALAEWHSQASEDELVQDVQHTLETLGVPVVSPAGGPKKQSD